MTIGNYVDPDATRPAERGECRCPGTPHQTDSATVVTLFGYGDRGAIRQAGRLGGPEAFKLMAILRGVKAWNLVLPDGKARPIDVAQLERLDEGTVDWLIRELDPAFDEDPLPKRRSDRSRSGSRANGNSTRMIRTPSPFTTR